METTYKDHVPILPLDIGVRLQWGSNIAGPRQHFGNWMILRSKGIFTPSSMVAH